LALMFGTALPIVTPAPSIRPRCDSYLSDLPIFYLALAIVGVPLAAAAAGWLLAGREPPAIARQVIE
jgi:hypothetical protein